MNWDRSELSSKLEAFKVHQGQERGEMLMQIRNLEVLTNDHVSLFKLVNDITLVDLCFYYSANQRNTKQR